jgi:amino-acid N-acetyltransferase
MHKQARASGQRAPRATASRPHLSATHAVRPAHAGDVAAIHGIVRRFAAQGAMLPRTRLDIQALIGDYVVVVDGQNRVLGCAALSTYSPSLAEVSSVAIARSAQGQGLGSLAVRGVEALARERGLLELFAMTTAESFFESLGYERSSVEHYPEKLARYEMLRAAGVHVVERACYRKLLNGSRGRAPQAAPQRQSRRRAVRRPTG